jgi:hypothetical protein
MESLLLLGFGTLLPAEPGLAAARHPADLNTAVIAQPNYPTVQAKTRAAPALNNRRQPYEGVWGSSGAACRDQDGVNRLSIEGNRFYWYETRCRAHDIKAENARSWAMRMSCEGEGQRFRARPRLSLATPDRLILNGGPVGPTKRDVYVRCDAGRPR